MEENQASKQIDWLSQAVGSQNNAELKQDEVSGKKEMEERKREEEDPKERIIRTETTLGELMEKLMGEMQLEGPSHKRGNYFKSVSSGQGSAFGSTGTQDQRQYDFTSYSLSELEDVLDYWDEPDTFPEGMFEACEREVDRRRNAYRAWKAKNPSVEEDDDDSEFPRPKIPEDFDEEREYIIFATVTFDDAIRVLSGEDLEESVC